MKIQSFAAAVLICMVSPMVAMADFSGIIHGLKQSQGNNLLNPDGVWIGSGEAYELIKNIKLPRECEVKSELDGPIFKVSLKDTSTGKVVSATFANLNVSQDPTDYESIKNPIRIHGLRITATGHSDHLVLTLSKEGEVLEFELYDGDQNQTLGKCK